MPVPQSPSVSVVIPLAAAGRLPLLFAGLPPVSEIVVVVGPDEDTRLPLPRAARVIRQTRYGVGNAIACGVAAATGEVVVTLPGDGSCNPAELPRLVEALTRPAGPPGDSRAVSPVDSRAVSPVDSRAVSASSPDSRATGTSTGTDVAEGIRAARWSDLFLLWFLGLLLGCRPAGAGTGFRAFRRDHADRLGLPRVAGTDPAPGDGREVEVLLAARSRRAGLRVAEVPVEFYPPRDGTAVAAVLPAIIRERLARPRPDGPATATDSIVLLTGGTVRQPGTPPATGGVPKPPFAGPGPRATVTPDTVTPDTVTPDTVTPSTWPARLEPSPLEPSPLDPSPVVQAPAVPAPARRLGASLFAGPAGDPGALHRPTGPALRRWPAVNRAPVASPAHYDGSGNVNSSGIGTAGRPRETEPRETELWGTERRGPERLRVGPAPDPRLSPGRPGNGRPNADVPHRRRWRDVQTDGRRPDLRVINGEGTGSDGSRGHLRPV